MRGDLALVLDCGSTNIRAVALDPTGRLLAQSSRPNRSIPQPGGEPGWMIWDLDEVWGKVTHVSREVSSRVGPERVGAVIVTTWGADGAPVRRDGALTYPPISWQCDRTRRVVGEVLERISAWEIYKITGYQVIPFNTLFKLVWLRREAPRALEEAHTWLMMPGLLVHRLTGELHIEPTSASTMMAMSLGRRDWSDRMLELAGLDPSFFPDWSQPGDVVGHVTDKAGRLCGLRRGTPVVVGGHDTQFAILGSGAGPGEAILSSGTWEILEVRLVEYRPTRLGFREGLMIEADVEPGLWNPQLLMMGSAVLEWIRERLFPDLDRGDYAAMIGEAEGVPPGSGGVTLIPSFVRDSGPTRRFGTLGTLLGLTLKTSRGQIYRAALEGLSFQLRAALGILMRATGLEARGIRVVGGGSRNDLWNQIRADVTGLPITVTAQREATVIGAAMTALFGIGTYGSLEEAGESIRFEEQLFEPSGDRALYDGLFERYAAVPAALRRFYRHGLSGGC